MEYTLADAAKAARVNKSTLFRAIKSGRLSARRLDDGSYRVDASELTRVYDLQHLTRGGTNALQRSAPAAEAPATAAMSGAFETELAVLRVRLEAAQDQLARADRAHETTLEMLDHVRRQLDEANAERRALQLRLNAPAASEKPQERPAEVVDLRKRLEEAEARIAMLAASEKPQKAPVVAPAAVWPPRGVTGLLARLLGR